MIARYTYPERLMHWMTAGTYTYCFLTGMALYTPHLFWVAQVLGGGPTSRAFHPVSGVLFFALILWMHSVWQGDMKLSAVDRTWLARSGDYAVNKDELVPAQDKFNAGQKVFYWLMFYAAFALLITGAVMWFPEYVPRNLAWLRPAAVILHVISALLTIGGFIVHLYMSLFLVPGSTEAMLSGSVPAAWAKAHHRLWYDRLWQSGASGEAGAKR